VFGAQARFRSTAVEIKGESRQHVRVGDEGNRVAFRFCPQCGSTVYWGFEGREEFVVVAVGAFAEPGFPAPTVSVYESRRHAWVGMPDKIEHFA
jgi:hypothetical protein